MFQLNNSIEFKAILMRNRREKLMEIPNDSIKNVVRNLEDIDTFDIEIPKYVVSNNKKVYNPLHLKITAMQMIIVSEKVKDEVVNTRYILKDKSTDSDRNKGIKKFKAYSYEETLKKKRCAFEGKVMQLYYDGVSEQIGDGVLNKFERETGWKVKYVDEKSKVETRLGSENVIVNLFDNYKIDKVLKDSLIFEKDVVTNISNDKALYLSLEYQQAKVYDEKGNLLAENNIINTITEALHTNITHVKAYHTSVEGNRYGIRYEFTLSDGTKENRICTFTNCIDKKLEIKNVKLVWETGDIIEKTNVKYINIESVDSNWYDTLRDFQDQFKSLFIFDGYNRTISCIHRDNLSDNAFIPLSYDNTIISTKITENSTYPNSLKVIGKDGLSIASENIFGGDVIYNFDYYIKNGLMTDELQEAWARYETFLSTKQEEWLIIRNNRYNVQQLKTRVDSEIYSLEQRLKYLKNMLTAYISTNDTVNQEKIKLEMDGLEQRLNECLSQQLQYKSQLDSYDEEMLIINTEVKRENATDGNGKIFTEDDLLDLEFLYSEEVYNDDYYSTPYGLLSNAKEVLKDMVKPTIDFDIEARNMVKVIKNKNFEWNFIFKLGMLFKLDCDDLTSETKSDSVRLVSYTYDPSVDKVSKMTFTNKLHKINNQKHISNIGRKTNATNNIIKSFREVWEDSRLENNFVKSLREKGLDLSATIASSKSESNYITIDECGILVENQQDRNRALYVSSGLFCISRDGFKTSEVAITPDGIISDLLIGKIILGNSLYITTDIGEFYIGNTSEGKEIEDFGLKISDVDEYGTNTERVFLGVEEDDNGIRRAKLRLVGKDGSVNLSEDGILVPLPYQDRSAVDNNCRLESTIQIPENMSNIKSAKMLIKLNRFKSYSKGASSGGGSVAVGSIQTANSTLGGGGIYKTITGKPNSTKSLPAETGTMSTNHWGGRMYIDVDIDNARIATSDLWHKNPYTHYLPEHTHDTEINVQPHSHDYSINTTTNIELPNHTHPNELGCYFDTSKPSNCILKVNDVVVRSGINSDLEIDIAEYLKTGENSVVLESMTRGEFYINTLVQGFMRW